MTERFHILLVDDQPPVRAQLAALIQSLGQEYTPYPAANASEALWILDHHRVDFALLDQNLAETSGWELLRQIQQRHPEVLVVMVTGQPSYSQVLEAWHRGAADFLCKPFDLAELDASLARLRKIRCVQEQKMAAIPMIPEEQPGSGLSGHLDCLARKLRLLQAIGAKLEGVCQREVLYPVILQLALDLTGARQATVLGRNHARNRLEIIASLGDGDLKPLLWKAAHQALCLQTPVVIEGQKIGTLDNGLAKHGLALPLRLRRELFGILVVSNKPPHGFSSEDLLLLNLLAARSSLALENLTLYGSVVENLYDALRALVNSLEGRDPYNGHHSERVTQIALRFAHELGLPQDELNSIRIAGYLHDIGKVGIRDAILLKPGKLTPEERTIIETHPLIGEKIVAPLKLLPREKDIILHHHERWDGTGYPYGLAATEIPFLSRLLALADTYDALTSHRPYRSRRTRADALQEIRTHAGSQFDPELAHSFIQMMEKSPSPRPFSESGADPGLLSDF